MEKIIKALEAKRKEMGLNYNELSKQCGVAESSVKSILQGKQNASMRSIISIALALGYKFEMVETSK